MDLLLGSLCHRVDNLLLPIQVAGQEPLRFQPGVPLFRGELGSGQSPGPCEGLQGRSIEAVGLRLPAVVCQVELEVPDKPPDRVVEGEVRHRDGGLLHKPQPVGFIHGRGRVYLLLAKLVDGAGVVEGCIVSKVVEACHVCYAVCFRLQAVPLVSVQDPGGSKGPPRVIVVGIEPHLCIVGVIPGTVDGPDDRHPVPAQGGGDQRYGYNDKGRKMGASHESPLFSLPLMFWGFRLPLHGAPGKPGRPYLPV